MKRLLCTQSLGSVRTHHDNLSRELPYPVFSPLAISEFFTNSSGDFHQVLTGISLFSFFNGQCLSDKGHPTNMSYCLNAKVTVMDLDIWSASVKVMKRCQDGWSMLFSPG
ncbi:hypothetical protein TcWFU_000132 [Taenia crassiceps]|uniref:Uncharacterized protein n=1 Tax=Taenia crassiceps TaxID=6207 RepID=A0ABR4Q709_9CEST